MKQSVILILLIATVSAVGYALYVYYRGNHAQGVQDVTGIAQPTEQADSATPTVIMATSTHVPIAIIVPTPLASPSRLPNTGAIDASTAWSDTPAATLLVGLFVVSTTLWWLGRNQ